MRSMTSIFPAFLRLLLSAALAMTIVMAQGVRGAKAQGYYDDDPDGPPPMPRQERRDSYNDNGPYDPSADDNDDYEDGRSVPDVSYFYDPLERDGRWVDHPRYGLVWMPRSVDRHWRPYSMGHWAYTDDYGWYWVSDEPFGWATYHYGRWYYDERYGWVWVPGTRWAPAWVAWRSSNDYIGWAPLPPDAYWEPRYGLRYDASIFDSPSFSIYWSFVEPAYIVEPHIQHHFIPFDRQRSIFFSTRAETHYEFVNKRIVNRGIPIRRIEEHAKVRIVPHRITASSDGSFRGSDRIDGDDIKVFRPKLTRRDDGPGGAGPKMPDKNRGSAWYNVDQMKKNPAALSPHPRYNAGPSDDDPRNGKGDFGRDGTIGNGGKAFPDSNKPKSGSFWSGNTGPSDPKASKDAHEDEVFRKYRGDPPATHAAPQGFDSEPRGNKTNNAQFGRSNGSVNGGSKGGSQAYGQAGGNQFGRTDRDNGSGNNGKKPSPKDCEGPNCPKPDKY